MRYATIHRHMPRYRLGFTWRNRDPRDPRDYPGEWRMVHEIDDVNFKGLRYFYFATEDAVVAALKAYSHYSAKGWVRHLWVERWTQKHGVARWERFEP